MGDDWRALLRRAGQPQQRNRAWSWCVRGVDNGRKADVAVLSKAGKVQMVASTANKRFAAGVEIGQPARSVRRVRSAGGGVLVRKAGNRAFVFATRGGRVRVVGVTTARLAGDRAGLRAAVRRVLAAKASNRRRRFVPAKAQEEGKMLGRTLASSGDQQVDARLALLCNLNL